jgi:hypothetical protein
MRSKDTPPCADRFAKQGVEAWKHVCLTSHVPAKLGSRDVQANAPMLTPTAIQSSADWLGRRHHRCYAGRGDRHALDRASGQEVLPHAKTGSIGALSRHTDVHDVCNTGVLPHLPHSKSTIYYHTILDALCIGANVHKLDGNKRYLRLLESQ